MKQANEQTWTVVFSGVDRLEMSKAFRGSVWQDTWFDRASRTDDGDDEAAMIVSIDVANLDELTAILKCSESVRPSWGIQLAMSAAFGYVRFSASLSTKHGGYLESSASMNQTAASVGSEIDTKLSQVDTLLHEIRILCAASKTD